MKCKKCKVTMKIGVALQGTPSGVPDFPNGPVCTVSMGPPYRMVSCFKCPKCGHSISIKESKNGTTDVY